MLVLTRKVGEAIVVPKVGLLLTVVEVHGDKVRLGLVAPAEVHVYRQEVWDRIQAARGCDGDGLPPAEDGLPPRSLQSDLPGSHLSP